MLLAFPSASTAAFKVYALGDSWTAAFGYYDDGSAMPFSALVFCRPGSGQLNDRCSSNSPLGSLDGGPLTFSKDYGYGNNISWVAQVAHQIPGFNAKSFVNKAVSGAEPKDYLPGGKLDDITVDVADTNPDLTLLTLGGNPLLGDVLYGIKECDEARHRGERGLYDCATDLINRKYRVPDLLADLYRRLLRAPDNHVVVSSYTTAIVPYFPANHYSLGNWETLGRALNDAIDRAVDDVKQNLRPDDARRLFLVRPVTVPMGSERSNGPVECSRYSLFELKWRYFRVDGPSALATIDQLDLGASQPFRFCGVGLVEAADAQWKDGDTWRHAGTSPWFNDQDLGTHLTRLGNQQLADAAMRVLRANDLLP
jgi:lysophospholipase L1-like esterase